MGLKEKGLYINDDCRMKETLPHMRKYLYIAPSASSTFSGYPMIQRPKLYAKQ